RGNMAFAVGRCLQILPCSNFSSSSSSAFIGKNNGKSWVTYLPGREGYGRHYSRAVVQAQQRPTWLPGLDPPPYLDGRFVETKRYMDFTNPGSQAKDGDFFGMEAALEGLEPGYPGGPLLNPLGLAKDIKNAHEWKLKEIKNGRLAMVAILGFFVQAQVTHVGPIDNLVYHLSDPWHRTIIQTLAGSG
ncbi:hypothetical protein C3L33_10947, partial [Rhododendron williamsianum]